MGYRLHSATCFLRWSRPTRAKPRVLLTLSILLAFVVSLVVGVMPRAMAHPSHDLNSDHGTSAMDSNEMRSHQAGLHDKAPGPSPVASHDAQGQPCDHGQDCTCHAGKMSQCCHSSAVAAIIMPISNVAPALSEHHSVGTMSAHCSMDINPPTPPPRARRV